VRFLPKASGRKGQGGQRLHRRDEADNERRPLLSIVTVSLNCGDQLQKTMESVLQWPADQVEYIIIDGGSTDETIDLLREFDSRLEYWVSEPDAGISDAFNKGISLCRGTVIGLLNAGDWYEHDALQSVRTGFIENPDAGVLCGRLQFRHGREKAYCTDSVPELLSKDMSVAHPSCFVKSSVYHRLGGFHPEYRLAMDYELLLRFFVAGVVFARTSAVLTNMQHDGVSELCWQRALHETHRARRQYIPRSFYAGGIYLRYLIARRYVRFLLQSLGLHGLIEFYRKHLAAVKKVRTK
jgi:glycosyltransferase involved in cell wall biosynthesis